MPENIQIVHNRGGVPSWQEGPEANLPASDARLFAGARYHATDTGKHFRWDGTLWVDVTPPGVTDHGALTGLADDDHIQYHTDARGDARYTNEADLSDATDPAKGDALVAHKAAGAFAALTIGTLTAQVRYVARQAGEAGNAVRVAHVNPNVANTVLSVAVSGNDVTVTLANGATAGTITSTANDVIAAVNASAAAFALLTGDKGTGDGTGTAVAQAMTSLSGGGAGAVGSTVHVRLGETPVHVKDFGAAGDGVTDDTAAIQAAIDAVNPAPTSRYETPGQDIRRGSVIFGTGKKYLLGDVVLKSGVKLIGHGRWATHIYPKAGASWCFTTSGTGPLGTEQMKEAAVIGMSFGSDARGWVNQPDGVGGLNIQHAQHCLFRDLQFWSLYGDALNFGGLWDSDVEICNIVSIGLEAASTGVGLRMDQGTGGTDTTNAVRVYGLRIEGCPRPMQLGPNVRHIFFIAPKFEQGLINSDQTGNYIIEGAKSCSFVAPELTWNHDTLPMFDFKAAAGPVKCEEVAFLGPVLHGSNGAPPTGYYFNAPAGSAARIQIIEPVGRNVRKLLNGENVSVRGGHLLNCGPNLMTLIGGSRVRNFDALDLRPGADAITISGADNDYEGGELNAGAYPGTTTDTWCFIRSSANSNRIRNVKMRGVRQYGFITGTAFVEYGGFDISGPPTHVAGGVTQTVAATTTIFDRPRELRRISSAADVTVTAATTITAGTENERVRLHNVGSFIITLQEAGTNVRLGAATLAIGPNQSVEFQYIGGLWRRVSPVV